MTMKYGLKTMVRVRWTDSLEVNGWMTGHPAEPIEVPPIETIGFLLGENADFVTVTGTISTFPDSSLRHLSKLTIPKGAIRELRVIDPPDEEEVA